MALLKHLLGIVKKKKKHFLDLSKSKIIIIACWHGLSCTVASENEDFPIEQRKHLGVTWKHQQDIYEITRGPQVLVDFSFIHRVFLWPRFFEP